MLCNSAFRPLKDSFSSNASSKKVLASATVASLALLSGVSAVSAQTVDMGKLPWQGGVSAKVSQTGHYDGWVKLSNALDIALSANTKVRAPLNSKVTGICIAKGTSDHAAIKLESTGLKSNVVYSLIHVKVDPKAVKVGTTFRQGDQIGVVASDKPNDPKCAVSYGIHLHFGLPSKDIKIDGYTFSSSFPKLNSSLTSNNSK